jgi:hypothetical protein
VKILRDPKTFPFVVVIGASLGMGFLILHGDPAFPTFPLLVFIFSKLSLLFGAIELGLSFTGQYESKEAVYSSIMRAITAFGLSGCLIILVSAYEVANR